MFDLLRLVGKMYRIILIIYQINCYKHASKQKYLTKYLHNIAKIRRVMTDDSSGELDYIKGKATSRASGVTDALTFISHA